MSRPSAGALPRALAAVVAALALSLGGALAAHAGSGTGTISGHLTGAGAPLSSGTVSLLGSNGLPVGVQADGSFTLTAPADTVRLSVQAGDAWTPQVISVDVPEDGTVEVAPDLVPNPRNVVSGTVTLGGAAIADARVTASAQSNGAFGNWSATTDASGHYEITGIWADQVSLYVVDTVDPPRFVGPSVPGVAAPSTRDIALTAPATGTGEVSGRVTDAVSGDPIERAFVSLFLSGAGGTSVSRNVQTSADGTYRFESLPAGQVNLNVSAFGGFGQPGHVSASSYFPLADGQQKTRDFPLKRQRIGTGSISGTITETSGRVVRQGYVSAFAPTGGPGGSSPVDAQGHFSLANLVSGTYRLSYFQGGFGDSPYRPQDLAASTVVLHTDDEAVQHDIVLERYPSGSAGVRGVVRDSATGLPVSGAAVSLSPAVFGNRFGYKQTGPDGVFDFSGFASGDYSLWISPPQGSSYQFGTNTDLHLGDAPIARDLVLDPVPAATSSLAGRITDRETHLPIAGAELQLYRERGGIDSLHATTDASGRYTVPALPSGRYGVGITADGYAESADGYRVEVAGAGESADFELTTSAAPPSGSGHVDATVVDRDGVAVSNAYVSALTASPQVYLSGYAQTDDAGLGSLENMPPTDLIVRATVWDPVTQSNQQGQARVSLDDAHPRGTVRIVVDTPSVIAGTIDPGTLPADATVTAVDAAGDPVGSAVVDPKSGHYEVTGLYPGRYRLRVSGDVRDSGATASAELVAAIRYWSDSSATGVVSLDDATVVEVSGAAYSGGHDFRLVAGGAIDGRIDVATSDGDALLPAGKEVVVHVLRRDGSRWDERSELSTRVDGGDDPSFSVRALPDGTYTLRFEDPVLGHRSLRTTYLGGGSTLATARTLSVEGGVVRQAGAVTMSYARPSDDPDVVDLSALDADTVSGLEGGVSTDAVVAAGEETTIRVGEGFAGEWVAVWANSTPTRMADWVRVSSDGTVRAVVPSGLSGSHRIVVQDADQNAVGWSAVRVTAAGPIATTPTGGAGGGTGTVPGAGGTGATSGAPGSGAAAFGSRRADPAALGATARPSASALARTGLDGTAETALAALVLLVAGGAVLVLRRRVRRLSR